MRNIDLKITKKTVKVLKVVVFLLLTALAGCDGYELFDLFDSAGDGNGGEEKPLSIVPVSVTLEVGSELTFTATGGVPPYTFSIVSGSGMINRESGVYIAPLDSSVDIIQVADQEGSFSQAQVVVVY